MADSRTAKKAAAKKTAAAPTKADEKPAPAPDSAEGQGSPAEDATNAASDEDKGTAEKNQDAADSGAPQRKQGEEQPIDVVVVQGNTHPWTEVEDTEAYTPPKESK